MLESEFICVCNDHLSLGSSQICSLLKTSEIVVLGVHIQEPKIIKYPKVLCIEEWALSSSLHFTSFLTFCFVLLDPTLLVSVWLKVCGHLTITRACGSSPNGVATMLEAHNYLKCLCTLSLHMLPVLKKTVLHWTLTSTPVNTFGKLEHWLHPSITNALVWMGTNPQKSGGYYITGKRKISLC